MRPRYPWLLFALSTGAAAQAPAPLVPHASAGVVYEDRNSNGARDPGEPGIAGVAVSNQEEVTRTDASGAYRLAANGFGAVFVSIPSGFRATGPFWRRADTGGSVDFGFVAHREPATFVFALASDTHLAEASIPRTRRLRAVVDSVAPEFVLITGDLVRDALRVGEREATGYYDIVRAEFGAFRTPLFTVPGNHEIFGIERERSGVAATHPLFGRGMYRAYRGPDYYSFNHGGVHFVGLNSVDVTDGWYHGRVDSLQLAWLARDLAMVPPEMPVVTFNHIPFYSVSEELSGFTEGPPAPTVIMVAGKPQFRHTVSNARAVIALVAPHPYPLALAGHVHYLERISFAARGQPTRFHQSAATVGGNNAGGFIHPSGVTFYTVTNGVIDDGRFVPLDPAP